jgi:pyruvate dehydrogenase E2 component (dihydrolipoamide acetyltransferase)
MLIEIRLTALSAGMEKAVIARWLKSEGADVREGEVIAEIETDKATMELEASASGRLARINVAHGQSAAVGSVIGLLLADGESEDALPETAGSPSPALFAPGPANSVADPSSLASTIGQAGAEPTDVGPLSRRIKASPLARRLAVAAGLRLEQIAGSGPGGRIVRLDVERAGPTAQPGASIPAATSSEPGAQGKAGSALTPPGIGPFEAVPHSSIRRTIAQRLTQSKATVPHFYLNAECEIDAMLELRASINATRAGEDRISINDFILKACASALRAVPEANQVWTSDAMLRLANVDVSVAVATEGGLFTPVIRDADKKTLGTLSREMKSLATRAKEGLLKPEDYQGGAFTLTNLGMHGVSSFAAIINPPQSAILAVGAAQRRPVEKNGALAFASTIQYTLSIDHRAIDGALGARLLAAFKTAIESPMALLV